VTTSFAQHGLSGGSAVPGALARFVRTARHAWSQARADRRERERLWQAAIADARALAERGRAMSREAVPPTHGDSAAH
jgi:hypothetical protein